MLNAIARPRTTPRQKNQTLAYITQQLTSYRRFIFSEQPYAHPETGNAATGGINLVATLPGQNPRRRRLCTRRALRIRQQIRPGADDDASAIAALLETARLLSTITQPAIDFTTDRASDRAIDKTPSTLPFRTR